MKTLNNIIKEENERLQVNSSSEKPAMINGWSIAMELHKQLRAIDENFYVREQKGYEIYMSYGGLTLFKLKLTRKKLNKTGWGCDLTAVKITLEDDRFEYADFTIGEVILKTSERIKAQREKADSRSKERVSAFTDILEKHGISVQDFKAIKAVYGTLNHTEKKEVLI